MAATTGASSGSAITFTRTQATWAAYLLVTVFAYLEAGLGPTITFIRADLDLSYTVASMHFAAFAIGLGISGVAGERFARRSGRARVIWVGAIGAAAGAVLVALSPVAAGTIAGAFLIGAFGAVSLVTQQASLSDIHGDERTIAFAESNVFASAGAALAPLALGGFAAIGLGWQTALLITLPATLLVWVRFRSTEWPPLAATGDGAPGSDRLPRVFWLFWLSVFLCSAVEWCVAFWGADYLASEGGLATATAATLMSVFFAAMMGGRLIGSRLARHYPGPALLLAAIAVSAIGFPVFWLADNAVVKVIGLFVAGLGIANYYPLGMGSATGAAPGMADKATARMAIASAISLLLAPIILAGLSDAVGMQRSFAIVIPLLAAAFIVTQVARSASASPATPLPQPAD